MKKIIKITLGIILVLLIFPIVLGLTIQGDVVIIHGYVNNGFVFAR